MEYGELKKEIKPNDKIHTFNTYLYTLSSDQN